MLQKKKVTITVHQTLHGYDDGHRQLAASNVLPVPAMRRMQVLSDMSGQTMLPGFDEYLTGYPLVGSPLYAFARTWYAPEMNRPGCVWTHTLLIPEDGMTHIEHFSVLTAYFRRPKRGMELLEYGKPIELVVPDARGFVSTDLNIDYARQLLIALYSPSGRPVLATPRAMGIDDLVIALWSQQWPKLRMSFAFCTGALSLRKVDTRPLDIQIVPRSVLNQVRGEKVETLILTADTAAESQTWKPWVHLAVTNLADRESPIFRDFIMEFGDLLGADRSGFAPLIDTYLAYQRILGGDRVNRLVEVLASRFPDPNVGRQLKSELLGGRAWINTLPGTSTHWREKDLLFEIAATEHYLAFDADSFRLRERGQLLTEIEPDEGMNLALALTNSPSVNPLRDEVLKGIARGIDTSRDAAFLQANRNLLLQCVRYNPVLATFSDFWRDTPSNQRELLNAVAEGKASEETGKTVVTAMLKARAEIAEEAVNVLGESVLVGALDWIDSSGEAHVDELPKAWTEALSARPRILLTWLMSRKTVRPATGAMIVSMLDPHSPQIHKIGTEFWLESGLDEILKQERGAHLRLMVFLLALGLDNPGPRSDEVVAKSFEAVHDAAERDELPYESWALLESQLPRIWWDWDRCERLRRGLAERFVNYGWNPQEFLKAAKRADTFRRVVLYCSESQSGRGFLRKVRSQVRQRAVIATEDQRLILDQYSPKYQRRAGAL